MAILDSGTCTTSALTSGGRPGTVILITSRSSSSINVSTRSESRQLSPSSARAVSVTKPPAAENTRTRQAITANHPFLMLNILLPIFILSKTGLDALPGHSLLNGYFPHSLFNHSSRLIPARLSISFSKGTLMSWR